MTPSYERHDSHHEGVPLLETILIELRELRTDFNTTARDTGARLSTLETHLESVVGGQQPGRLTILENKVSDIQHWRWHTTGIYIGVSSLVSVGAAFLFHLWK